MLGRRAGDQAFDVEQRADLLERFSCNRRSAGLCLVEEAAPYVRPAGDLDDARWAGKRQRRKGRASIS